MDTAEMGLRGLLGLLRPAFHGYGHAVGGFLGQMTFSKSRQDKRAM
jgi:hypothetical protein